MPGPISSSSNVTGGDDIAELRALLANGGLTNGVLEGKFLNQLRRTRHLGVQLESEKTRVRQLEAQLNDAKAQLEGQRRENNSPKPKPRSTSEEGPQQSVSALRERLDRAYAQLNDAKMQLEEQRRESQRMRRLLQQEIGGTAQDLDALLRNTQAQQQQQQQQPAEPNGWRGRAQQIVVLKGRVKELERALASAHHNSDQKNNDHNSDHPLLPVARGNARAGSHCSGDTAELTSARRDVDDAAREHVAALHGRRLQQQRELQEALEQRAAEVDAQRRRADAAAARHANLEAGNQTLREYLQSLVRKTENDNDLIDAYREEMAELRRELHEARTKLRDLEQWLEGETPEYKQKQQKQKEGEEKEKERNQKKRKESETDHALDNGTAVALAGADAAIELHRLKMENAELRHRLSSKTHKSHANSHSNDNNNNNSNRSSPIDKRGNCAEEDDAALVVHWLRSVAGGPETGGAAQWPSRVANVLRRAHNVVRQFEHQREQDTSILSQCYEEMQRLQKQQQRKGEEGRDEAIFAQIVVQENQSLKKRLRTLQDLMEREVKAYESLWSAAQGIEGDGK